MSRRKCLSNLIHHFLYKHFKRWGGFVGRHPYAGLMVGIIITAVAGLGMLLLEFSNNNDLYLPQKTLGYKYRLRAEAVWGEMNMEKSSSAIMSYRGNILDPSPLQEAYLLYAQLKNAVGTGGETWNSVCVRQDLSDPTSPCAGSSVFDLLQIDSLEKLQGMNVSLVLGSLPSSYVTALVGGVTYNEPVQGQPSLVTSASAFLLYFPEDYSVEATERTAAWEERFYTICENRRGSLPVELPGTDLAYFNYWGFDIETQDLISQEYPLMGGTVVLILCYMCFILGGRPFARSRILLGTSCLISVACSMLFAFGVSGYVGMPFTILSPLLFFVLLGVGVDDMIIISSSFDCTSAPLKDAGAGKQYSVEACHTEISDRMAQGLGEAAYAITVTSVASFAGFMFSSMVDFPAITYFCLMGGLGIGGLYSLQLSIFVALLVLDERRVYGGRYDVVPCIKVGPTANRDRSSSTDGELAVEETGAVSSGGAKGGRMDRCMGYYLTTVLHNRTFRNTVLLVFLLVTIWSAYMLSKITSDSDINNFFEPNSNVRRYFSATSTYFGTSKREAFFFFDGPIQYHDPATQLELKQIVNQTMQLDIVVGVTFWLTELEDYAGKNNLSLSPPAQFYSSLRTFLAAPSFYRDGTLVAPQSFSSQLLWLPAPQGDLQLQDTRMKVEFSWRPDVVSQVANAATLRALVAPDEAFPPAPATRQGTYYIWSFEFTISDRDSEMVSSIVANLLSSALGVIGALALIVDPLLVLLIATCVVMIDVDLLGMMSAWGMPLDVSAFIVLAMAIGLAVDYVVHIAHAFLTDLETPKAEIEGSETTRLTTTGNTKKSLTLGTMGTSVLNGGLSTFLGVCLLGFAKSPGFRTVFRVLFGTVLFGIAHGLLFAPVVLTALAPCLRKYM